MDKLPMLTIKSNPGRMGLRIELDGQEVPCCRGIQFIAEAGEVPIVKLSIIVGDIDIESNVMTELEAIAILKQINKGGEPWILSMTSTP